MRPLSVADLEGQTLAEIMRALYEDKRASIPSVCSYVLGTGVRGLAQPLDPQTHSARSVEALVTGWTGSIWIGAFSDYELAWAEPMRVVLVSTRGVPPPHQGYYETVGNALEFVRILGDWRLNTLARLFDCHDPSSPLPDGIGSLARRHQGEHGYFLYDVEEVVDDDHTPEAEAEHRYSILEIADPNDWPPTIDLPALADLLTETAREHWSVDFACVNVTRRSVDSGDEGSGLTEGSPIPEGILAIFEELRYDPHETSLTLINEESVIMAWVESFGAAGQVNAAEFVRVSNGQWLERTWVSMYTCSALGN